MINNSPIRSTRFSSIPSTGEPKGRKKQLIFEQRIWSPYVQEGYENGAAFYGTEGVLILGHTKGWKLYGPRMKLIAENSGPVELPRHHQNFFDCIRGEQKKLNADVKAGHLAAGIVHLANIAARVGGVLQFDPQKEQITNNDEANALCAGSIAITGRRRRVWLDGSTECGLASLRRAGKRVLLAYVSEVACDRLGFATRTRKDGRIWPCLANPSALERGVSR